MVAFSFFFALFHLGSPNFYVSTTGSDLASGSQDAPWRTVQYACDHVPSGAVVNVLNGVYRERVTIKVPMVLQSPGVYGAVIDGEGLTVPASDAAMVLIKNVDHVSVAGFEIRNFRTTDSSRIPAGILVEGKADDIALVGNQIHHIGNDGAKVKSINAFGVAVYGNSKAGAITRLRIADNEIHHTKTGWSETVAINGNVDGFSVRDNSIHDVDNIGIDCIGFEGTSPIKGKDQARKGTIVGNSIERVSSSSNPAYHGSLGADGIYVDGGTGIVVDRNVIHAADIGIEVASEHGGKDSSDVIVRNNHVTRCRLGGLSIGGYEAKRGGTRNCTLVNNTLAENDASNSGTGELSVQYNVENVIFANNILAASTQGIVLSTSGGKKTKVGLVADYNLFYAPGSATWNWKGQSYASLAAFGSATKLDGHSRFGDPQFRIADDYVLSSSSPAHDAGWNFGPSILGTLDLALNDRVHGPTVDIGAYEVPIPFLQTNPRWQPTTM